MKETLDSVFAQTYKNIEVICVDNGSTDSTLKIIAGYRDRQNIKLLIEPKKGANFARNTGINNANGEVLQFLDSDDTIENKKIELQIEGIKNGYDIVVSDRKIYNTNLTKLLEKISYSTIENDTLEVCISKIIITGNPLYRKTALINSGNWLENLDSAQDWELNIRMALHGKKFGYVTGYFLNSRRHSNSLSYDWIKVNLNAIYVLEMYKPKIMLSTAFSNKEVQKKIFFSYFLAAIYSKNNIDYITELKSWRLGKASTHLRGINKFLCQLFGLKFTVQLRSLFSSPS